MNKWKLNISTNYHFDNKMLVKEYKHVMGAYYSNMKIERGKHKH